MTGPHVHVARASLRRAWNNRTKVLARPVTRWAIRLFQPSQSLSENAPVPQAVKAKSCTPTPTTAAASSGGGSRSNAIWVNPR